MTAQNLDHTNSKKPDNALKSSDTFLWGLKCRQVTLRTKKTAKNGALSSCTIRCAVTLCRPTATSGSKPQTLNAWQRKPLNFRISMWARCPACQLEGNAHRKIQLLAPFLGPVGAFDDSMPAILDKNGVHSHKVTDHHHYWEDGGATYHQRYTTFDLVRGQEGDKWIGDVEKLRDPAYGSERWPEHQRLPFQKQDNINREHMGRTELQPQYKTFSLGLDFIERNRDADRWYLK